MPSIVREKFKTKAPNTVVANSRLTKDARTFRDFSTSQLSLFQRTSLLLSNKNKMKNYATLISAKAS